jgi:RNA polymerase sigma-70 factor (ECF subfamily)
MLTAGEIGIFQLDRAEVPHHAVAFTLTYPETPRPATSMIAHTVTPAEAKDADLDDLVVRAKAGDSQAFDELLVAMRPRAMAAALRVLHNRDDAEDAVQDAFLKVWRCLAAFEGRSSFSTWLHRIVSNASLDLLRRNATRSEFAERTDDRDVAVADREPSHEHTPEADLVGYEIQMLVRAAVAALPAVHRQAVELRDLEDYSYQEMAEIIQCPVGTVMSRLHHARNKLAGELRAPLGDSFEQCAA